MQRYFDKLRPLNPRQSQPRLYQVIIFTIALLMMLVGTVCFLIPSKNEKTVDKPSVPNKAIPLPKEVPQPPPLPVSKPVAPTPIRYTVKFNDTLSSIFRENDISLADMHRVLEVDAENLILDNLKPGDEIRLWVKPGTSSLTKLEIQTNPRELITYTKTKEGDYDVETTTYPIEAHQIVTQGVIDSSFAVSARKAGLSYNDIEQATNILKHRVNFSRDLHQGDTFTLLQEQYAVNGQTIDSSKILAIILKMKKKTVSLYLHNNGHYYSNAKDKIHSTFLSRPTADKWRISSYFNSNRRHPVTGRRQPHHGIDFAVPVGTPVLSVGDGIVTQAVRHPYAGRYLVIKHNSKYKTRYLHNSKLLVKKGERVSKGQVIALSGKSGRVTGPHIHYELLINDKPVNPLRANIPVTRSSDVPKRDEFNKLIEQYTQSIRKLTS